MKRFSKKFLLVSLGVFLIAVFSSAAISYAAKEREVQQDEQRRKELYGKILGSASISPTKLTVNYSKTISTGSPLIFGGSHAPEASHIDAWNKITEVGITSIRKDFFPENALPRNITLEDYKNNVGEIQNTENWNQTELNKINDMYKNAHQRGMKTIGIVAYAPAWLTYSNTIYGVPKDWGVYEDIVMKTYRVYRDNLDYVEIWNEPNFDYFLNTSNSGMSRDEAYKKIYIHAVNAIRKVDKEINDGKQIPIGGPAGYDPIKTSALETLLSDPNTAESLNFVSYHNYDAKHLKEPSWVNYKDILKKYNKDTLPVFITEWNYEPDSMASSPYHTSDLAIAYTGNKFTDFLKMGLAGANYHVIEPLNPKLPNRGEGYMGFYRWVNNKAELLPQAKTWRLMSSKMGLGKGNSYIYEVTHDDPELNSVGFINGNGQYGMVIVNSASVEKMTDVFINDTKLKNNSNLGVYYASSDQDAKNPIYQGKIKFKKGSTNLQIYLPANSVAGVLFTEEKAWYDVFKLSY